MYKASFNGLKVHVEGIYNAYNLSYEELDSLKRHFGFSKVAGANGNYTIYAYPEKKVFLELFVHEVWVVLRVDIYRDLLRLFNCDIISQKDIDCLSKKMKTMKLQLHVKYNFRYNYWSIVDYENFLELLANLIAEL